MSDLLTRTGFGCVALTTLPTQRAALRVLAEAFAGGIRHFDTAPLYGRGYSEEILGVFLRTQREPIAVTTKFGLGAPSTHRHPPAWLALPAHYFLKKWQHRPTAAHPPTPETPASAPPLGSRRITRDEIQSSFDRSRRVLRRDRIDYYLLHEALPSSLDADALDYLRDLKTRGLIGRLGLGAGGINYLALDPTALTDWDVLQYEFGPAWPGTIDLPNRFPAHTPIFHSSLKNHTALRPPHTSPAEWPAHILRDCLAAHPQARVLFSSSNLAHIRANLRALALL